MKALIRKVHTMKLKRSYRQTPYVQADGMFDTKLFYEKQGDL